jgi:hypothetical protein
VVSSRTVSTRIITYQLLLFIAEKNGVGATTVDMKTPTARKQASRRITATSGQKPTPLRGEYDHLVIGNCVCCGVL